MYNIVFHWNDSFNQIEAKEYINLELNRSKLTECVFEVIFYCVYLFVFWIDRN